MQYGLHINNTATLPQFMSKRNKRQNRKRRGRNGRGQGNQLQSRQFEKLIHGVSERNPYRRNDEDSLLVFRGLIVPDHFYTHLNYSEYALQLQNAAAFGAYVFRGNDCYDPNFTGTGHQPLGFDQLTALWSKFRVHGSHFEVKPTQVSQACTLGILPTLSGTPPTSLGTLSEQPYSKIMNIPSSTLVGNQMKLSGYIETRKVFGYPNIYQDDVFVGTTGASPASVFYWLVECESFDLVTTMTSRMDVKLTFDVEFFSRVTLTQS